MAGNETPETPPLEIPEDATVIRQSNWAWQLPAAPWVIFVLASFFIDAITFGVLPIFLACIVVVPRFVRWWKSLYILTEDHVIVFQGGLLGRRRYDLPITEFTDVGVRPGIFGGTLGYRAVDLSLREGGLVVLDYLPQDAPVAEHIRSRLGRARSDQDGPRSDAPTDGQPEDSGDQEESAGE